MNSMIKINVIQDSKHRGIKRQGAAGMLLDPLAEIKFRVLMAIVIHIPKSMVNFQGTRKGKHTQDHQDQAWRHA